MTRGEAHTPQAYTATLIRHLLMKRVGLLGPSVLEASQACGPSDPGDLWL